MHGYCFFYRFFESSEANSLKRAYNPFRSKFYSPVSNTKQTKLLNKSAGNNKRTDGQKSKFFIQ